MADYVLTPFAVASYPSLFKKSATCKEDRNKPENHKYQLTLLIPPTEQSGDAYKALKAEANTAFLKKFQKEDYKDKGFISPFKDAAEKYGDAYKGWVVIKAKTDFAPKVYDPTGKEITVGDDSTLSGVVLRAFVSAWAWDNSRKEKSVSFSLSAVKLTTRKVKSPDSSVDYSKAFEDDATPSFGDDAASSSDAEDDDDLPF
jgi:hypothetical protein